jgi:hypothetical protein
MVLSTLLVSVFFSGKSTVPSWDVRGMGRAGKGALRC